MKEKKKGELKEWIKENGTLLLYEAGCAALVVYAVVASNKRAKAIALQEKEAEKARELLISLAEIGADVCSTAESCVEGFVNPVNIKCDNKTFVRFTPEKITVE